MIYTDLTESNCNRLVPLYIDYYNNNEDAEWTEETAYKRIHSIVTHEDAYGLILEEEGDVIGFVMGYFTQYDDGVVYDLNEIVVAKAEQGRGLGTMLINELEKRVKTRGAFLIQLSSVNDEMHDHFYGKIGYKKASNFVLMSKII